MPRHRRAIVVSCLALIALHALFLVLSAVNNSVTYDEFAHLAAGCAYWRWQELSIYNQSPPLLRLLGSWPAMLGGAEVPDAAKFRKYPPKDRHWFYAAAFERANARLIGSHDEPRVDDSGSFQRLVVLGRIGIIPVSSLGAWLVFVWARRLHGDLAGLAACAMWAFDPDVIAHGSIVGTDVGAAVAMLLALLAWQRLLERPTAGRALAAALAVAVAHLCKFTALMLWPAMLVMLLWRLWRGRGDGGRCDDAAHDAPVSHARPLLLGLLIVIVTTWFAVNLGYGFNRTFEPLGKFDFTSRPMMRARDAMPWLRAPLPRQLLLGIDAQAWESATPRPAYLLGEQYLGGRWNYYPVALAVKLPLGLLALLALSLVSLAVRRPGADEIGLLLALATVTLGLACGSQLNVGVRYLLPTYPLAFIAASRVWRRDMPAALGAAGWLMIVLLAVESALVCPRYLTFFNALVGGPRGSGWRVVNDSNADWGQGLLDLRAWMRARGESRITLAYFGKADPAAYGIDYAALDDDRAPIETRYVAVSVYYLAGLPQRMPLPGGEYSDVVRLLYYRELQAQRPVDIIGNAFHVFTREQVEQARRARTTDRR